MVIDEDIVKKFFLPQTFYNTVSFHKEINEERNKFIKYKYPQYFALELKSLINDEWFSHFDYNNNAWIKEIKEMEIPDNFNELRKIGENENQICEIIRNDSIKEFIIYVNKNNLQVNATIKPSIYETNNFLIKQEISKNDK